MHQPVPEVLLPLWRAGYEPYTLAGIGIGWLIAATVVGTAVLVSPRAIGRRGQTAVAIGALVGLAAVAATEMSAKHPRSAANLRYVQKVWEPPPSGALPAAE